MYNVLRRGFVVILEVSRSARNDTSVIKQRGCKSRIFLYQSNTVKQIDGFTVNIRKIVIIGKLIINIIVIIFS